MKKLKIINDGKSNQAVIKIFRVITRKNCFLFRKK